MLLIESKLASYEMPAFCLNNKVETEKVDDDRVNTYQLERSKKVLQLSSWYLQLTTSIFKYVSLLDR